MAQWFVSASDADVLSKFTERTSGGSLSVVNDNGIDALRLNLPANNRVFWSFDTAGVGQDFEIVARLRSGSAAQGRTGAAVGARISGAAANIYAYRFADINFDGMQIGRYLNGAFLQLSNVSGAVQDITEYHWVRARVSGDLVQMKVWDGTPLNEPNIWTSEYTDPSIFPDGMCGLFVFEIGNHYYTDIGFGTNGDPAPTEPATGGITLSVNSLSLSMALDAAELSQSNQLTVDDLQCSTSLDAVTLQQANMLNPDDIALNMQMDSAVLVSAGQLSVNDLQLSMALDAAGLQQANQLSVDDLLLTSSLESPDLSVGLTLVPDSIWLATLLDQVSLTQSHVLTLDDLAMQIALDGTFLIPGDGVVATIMVLPERGTMFRLPKRH